jgi:hypothetical protein
MCLLWSSVRTPSGNRGILKVPSLCAMSSAGAVEIVDLTDSPDKRESPAAAVEPSGKTRYSPGNIVF